MAKRIDTFSQKSVANFVYAPGTNPSRLWPILKRCGIERRTKQNPRFTREEAQKIIETVRYLQGRRLMKKQEMTEQRKEFFRNSHALRDAKSKSIGALVSEEMRSIREESAALRGQYQPPPASDECDANQDRCETSGGTQGTEGSLTDRELFYRFHGLRR